MSDVYRPDTALSSSRAIPAGVVSPAGRVCVCAVLFQHVDSGECEDFPGVGDDLLRVEHRAGGEVCGGQHNGDTAWLSDCNCGGDDGRADDRAHDGGTFWRDSAWS